MPANLTPQYYEAEQAFKQARTTEEKIAALEEMLAVIPKHKGTEKLQADLKRRLSKLREEGTKKNKAARFDPFLVEKEGAGQAVLFGFPNSGKSSLVGALTRARVVIADYPYATVLPVSGMMPYEDILIQLVDTPPASENMEPGLINTLHNADLLLLVVDGAAGDCLDQLEGCLELLQKKKIIQTASPGPGRQKSLEQCLLVITKAEQAGDACSLLEEMVPETLQVLPVSIRTGQGLEQLPGTIFQMLRIIRVYSKVPGKEADRSAPFILPQGATVLEMAAAVHRDFPNRLKSARVWGSSRFPGQPVLKDYVLQDKDIVELRV